MAAVMAHMMTLMAVATTLWTPSLEPRALLLSRPIASGRFGTVHWAEHNGLPCVAKRASATFSSESTVQTDRQRADEYLETEAEINRLLYERALAHSSVDAHVETLAPYLGSCIKDDCRWLVWRAAGEETLDDYLVGADRLPDLARALGCDEAELPRRVLHDVLRALTHIHACGVAHRDVKPGNLLVDAKAQRLRLVDFGSAADCAGWLSPERHGLRRDRVPASMLFAAAGDLSPNGGAMAPSSGVFYTRHSTNSDCHLTDQP